MTRPKTLPPKYLFCTAASERLCYQSLEYTAKVHYQRLQEVNIALLEEHQAHQKDPLVKNRAGRVIDYLETKKNKPNAVFDVRLPVRFR